MCNVKEGGHSRGSLELQGRRIWRGGTEATACFGGNQTTPEKAKKTTHKEIIDMTPLPGRFET